VGALCKRVASYQNLLSTLFVFDSFKAIEWFTNF